MKLLLPLFTILVFTFTAFGQILAPKSEEFSVDVPVALSYEPRGGVIILSANTPASLAEGKLLDNRRYAAVEKGTYFYIFSDPIKKPQQQTVLTKFAGTVTAAITDETIGGFTGKKYEFGTTDGYFHRILIINTNKRAYVFQTISETKDDSLADAFFANLKLGDSVLQKTPDMVITKIKEDKKPITGNSAKAATNTPPAASADQKTPLKIKSKPFPKYTDMARYYLIGGVVRLRVTFGADGQIEAVEPVSKLPFGLTTTAIEAAKQIKFTPETINGVPQTVSKQLEYSFLIY